MEGEIYSGNEEYFQWRQRFVGSAQGPGLSDRRAHLVLSYSVAVSVLKNNDWLQASLPRPLRLQSPLGSRPPTVLPGAFLCPHGGMVDARDLKSLGYGRAGSSPVAGTPS